MKLNKYTAISALLGAICFAQPSYADEVPRTAFVHLFEWSWPDVATECETFLGPKGFAAVQVSPPQTSIDNDAWWSRYQPMSYAFEGRSGTRAQFQDMVSRCNAVGVDIYVDAVINHMAAADRYFPDVPYDSDDFHTCTSDIDYTNRWQVQNCDLVGLNDLKTESEYVRQKIADYMNDAISMGVAGFRIDAAKHIPAEDIAAIKSKLNGSPYIFQEVIGASGEPILTSEYTYIGNVTEFNYARSIGPKFKNGGINSLNGIENSDGWLASSDAVTFVTNHDEQRTNAGTTLTHKDASNLYFLGNVFTLAYPYGYPKIMSSYYFDDNDAGPPSTGVHSGNSCGFDGGDWVCEHEWRGVANMVAFRNYTASQWQVTDWWDNGYNQIAFGRGGLGFVAINRDDNSTLSQTLQTGMPAGVYCDVIAANFDEQTGECDGTTITVDSSGYATFNIAIQDAAAIHVGAKVGEACSDCSTDPQPENPVASTAICYDNSANFSTPTLYYWSALPDGSVADATWPGVAMTANGDFYCHDLGVELTSVNVIFSDNGDSQSDDLVTTSGRCYLNGEWQSLEDCGFTIDSGDTGGGDSDAYTQVCYDNAAGFSSPTLYYWSVEAASDVADATWPGVSMSEDNGVYCYDFGTNLTSLNVIFSDQGSNQTDNLSASSPNLCYQAGSWVDIADCAATTSVGDEVWYFRGTSNSWGLTQLEYDSDTGLYTTVQTFAGEESPARFKIDDGTWTESYPEEDYEVGDNATYQISFNSRAKTVTVSAQ